jgi:nucleoside-diphosphate-sugar epimerase
VRTVATGREVVDSDLNYIIEGAQEEFGRLAGHRLLITGGAGFLGYYMVQAVAHWNRIQEGSSRIQLTVFDNYARGVPAWLADINDVPNVSLRRHDIVEPLPSDQEPHFIIHAAGIASPTYYRAHPLETMDANVGGLRRLLDHALGRAAGADPLRGFLFFSSSEIYGDPTPDNIPTAEEYRGNVSCTGPRAPYDESKRYGETLCVTFARHHGLPVAIARPFNNYGPGLKITDRRVIPDFADNVLSGRDITLLSDGSATRTFCYAADAVTGYFKVLVRGRPGESYNIGVEEPEVTISQLADRVVATARELFGYAGSVVRGVSDEADYLVDNPNRRCPVIVKARSELGYEPRVDLDEGLRRSLLWYADHSEAASA